MADAEQAVIVPVDHRQMDYPTFLKLHRGQLANSGVPEVYWPGVQKKIRDEVYDAGHYFGMMQVEEDEEEGDDEGGGDRNNPTPGDHRWCVVVTSEDGVDSSDSSSIFLVDHAWTFQYGYARLQLQQVPGLLGRMAALMDICQELSEEEKTERVLDEMWRFTWQYKLNFQGATADDKIAFWYVNDEFGSRIQHCDEPACRMVPFYYVPTKTSYTLMWLLQDLDCGDEVTRDFADGLSDDTERKCRLLAWIPQDFTHISPNQGISVDDQFYWTRLKGCRETLPIPDATGNPLTNREGPYKVYMDIQVIRDNLTDSQFQLVEEESQADIVWTRSHLRDFKTFSVDRPDVYINQFPCEGILTVKDCLAYIGQRAVTNQDPEALENGPKWLPTTFNLAWALPQFVSSFQQREERQEGIPWALPQFVSCFQRREERGLDNHWILKPWNLARGLDTQVTNKLHHIIRLSETSPKVACKYLEDPVLYYREDVGQVKMDIRYIVMLQSVKPLKLFAYKVFWLRFANKPFSLDHLDEYEKHFTVMNYTEGGTKLHQVHYDDFIPIFEKQYPDFPWKGVELSIFSAFRELFESAVSREAPYGIGHYPMARSLYAIDLMLKWDKNEQGEKIMQPVLLEVNFCPDCDRACKYHPNFFNDIFSALFLNDFADRPVAVIS
ncbi:tubulin--tyrosine ligase-like protein 12 isoform X2 [Branchiostoma floridae]|uniref:Tubulin--tyrosine ligase-like protein 12 isoform X2 n=1 Tax=Branchiostoma floridae TaxID=7739 RepID=A0A9J7KK61_BRAFL|nr:tubulin--tyrosine ligase-like protein 12 isoform X2 [Branchiostoma floridae]